MASSALNELRARSLLGWSRKAARLRRWLLRVWRANLTIPFPKGLLMGAYNFLVVRRTTGEGLVLAISAVVFCVGLVSGRCQEIAKDRSAGTSNSRKTTKTGQDGFVGSRGCSPCHQNIYDAFTKTSMGRSMTQVTPGVVANLVTSGSSYVEKLNQHFEVFARDGKLFQSQYAVGAGGNEVFRETHEVQWIIGSGNNGFAGVTTQGPYLFQGPLSFYSKIGAWGLSPGYEFGNYGFNRPILAGCVACHSARAMPAAEGNGRFEDPPFQELAIGCENCHGPGEQHVREMSGKGTARKGHTSIVNPARLSPALADNICMFCHQTGDVRVLQPNKNYRDFRPGEPLDDTLAIFLVPPKRESPPPSDHVEHYYSMILSKCYRRSARALSCITCHDPHVQPSRVEAPAYFAGKCGGCHTDKSCTVPLTVRQQHNPPNDCAGCHMPKREVGVILHSSVTSHRIMAQPDEPLPEAAFHQTTSALPDLIHLSALPGQKEAAPPRLTLLMAYGELMDKAPEYRARYLAMLSELEHSQPENALVQASLGRRDLFDKKVSEAAAHLQHALEIGPAQATTYADLAEAQVQLGQETQAISSLEKAVELDPFNAVFQKKLVLRFIEMKQYPQAQVALERYVQTFPQDSFMREMLKRANAKEQPK
jgi:Flp pilus assembly protein TadD